MPSTKTRASAQTEAPNTNAPQAIHARETVADERTLAAREALAEVLTGQEEYLSLPRGTRLKLLPALITNCDSGGECRRAQGTIATFITTTDPRSKTGHSTRSTVNRLLKPLKDLGWVTVSHFDFHPEDGRLPFTVWVIRFSRKIMNLACRLIRQKMTHKEVRGRRPRRDSQLVSSRRRERSKRRVVQFPRRRESGRAAMDLKPGAITLGDLWRSDPERYAADLADIETIGVRSEDEQASPLQPPRAQKSLHLGPPGLSQKPGFPGAIAMLRAAIRVGAAVIFRAARRASGFTEQVLPCASCAESFTPGKAGRARRRVSLHNHDSRKARDAGRAWVTTEYDPFVGENVARLWIKTA
jgi:hypothetical protein